MDISKTTAAPEHEEVTEGIFNDVKNNPNINYIVVPNETPQYQMSGNQINSPYMYSTVTNTDPIPLSSPPKSVLLKLALEKQATEPVLGKCTISDPGVNGQYNHTSFCGTMTYKNITIEHVCSNHYSRMTSRPKMGYTPIDWPEYEDIHGCLFDTGYGPHTTPSGILLKDLMYGRKFEPCMKHIANYDLGLEKGTVEIVDMTKKDMNLYRTQKAQGLFSLGKHLFDVPNHSIKQIEDVLDIKTEEIKYPAILDFTKKFVRPCPVTPRHGFVDSRVCTTKEEAEEIIRETFKVDKKAEFILMSDLSKVPYSAIVTDGSLIVGKGNDGATAGKSSVTIPVIGRPFYNRFRWLKALQDGRITDSPYVELLYQENKYNSLLMEPRLVQLRNGPKVPASADFIPNQITVKHVVLAEGDLLEWESKVRKFAPGTVVYHPNGSLASHYAVHCVLSKIPIVISFKPKIGETLQPNTEVTEPNIKEMRAGFVYGATAKIPMTVAALIMLAACHNTQAWMGKMDFLLGVGMGCAYRMIVTSSIGEYRHLHTVKELMKGRNDVYKDVWDEVLTPKQRRRFSAASTSFILNHKWYQKSGFGGVPWYNVSAYGKLLTNALIVEDAKKALTLLNELTNVEHNGGWAFNKFTDHKWMSQAAQAPASIAVAIGPYLYEALQYRNEHGKLDAWFKSKKSYLVNHKDSTYIGKNEFGRCSRKKCMVCEQVPWKAEYGQKSKTKKKKEEHNG